MCLNAKPYTVNRWKHRNMSHTRLNKHVSVLFQLIVQLYRKLQPQRKRQVRNVTRSRGLINHKIKTHKSPSLETHALVRLFYDNILPTHKYMK